MTLVLKILGAFAMFGDLKRHWQSQRKPSRGISIRSSTAFDPRWKACWTPNSGYDPDVSEHGWQCAPTFAQSVNQLRHGSQVIEQLIHKEGLLVVGAEYSLETGRVDFFDGVPEVSG